MVQIRCTFAVCLRHPGDTKHVQKAYKKRATVAGGPFFTFLVRRVFHLQEYGGGIFLRSLSFRVTRHTNFPLKNPRFHFNHVKLKKPETLYFCCTFVVLLLRFHWNPGGTHWGRKKRRSFCACFVLLLCLFLLVRSLCFAYTNRRTWGNLFPYKVVIYFFELPPSVPGRFAPKKLRGGRRTGEFPHVTCRNIRHATRT